MGEIQLVGGNLLEPDRENVRHRMTKRLSSVWEPLGLTKPELKAAVDATDDYIAATQGDYNQALPEPARSTLTKQQKAELFTQVAGERYQVDA